MSSEWTNTTLGAVTKWSSGGTPKKGVQEFWGGNIPWISASSMYENRIFHSETCITEKGLENGSRLAKKDSILLLVRGSALHSRLPVGMAMRDVAFNQDVKALQANKRILRPWFLLYWLMSKRDFLLESVVEFTGIGAGKLDTERMQGLEFQLPSIEDQDRILKIIKPLDDLIEHARAQNFIFEDIARRLFRSWFVNFDPVHAKAAGREPEAMSAELAALFPSEFEESALGLIPKGWQAGTLGMASTNSREQVQPQNISKDTPYVGLEHIERKKLSLITWGVAEVVESGKFKFEKSDILFGKLRPYFHKVTVAPMSGVCSTDILVIKPRMPSWHGFVTQHLFSKAFIDYATQLSDGARMPRTNWTDTAKYPVVVPIEPLVKKFNEFWQHSLKLMHCNIELIRSLAELRDHLLPRLISGKLSLADAEAALAAVKLEVAQA